MTRHKHAQTGLVIPPLPQLLLTAVLRAFAMLVLNVVSTFQMSVRRRPVIGTRMTPDALPRMTTDTNHKETIAVPHDSSIALILSSTLRVRPSKDEGVLTTLSHTSPSPSVSLAAQAIHLPLLRRWRTRLRGIASTAEGGGGGLRALAR
ncbi:MAG: hypothetical protein Q8R82_21960, partial [Hyphomonadaceae bacterium]|nr:hypothetical protein [Hyphomonadaceae bacterium]